MTWLQWSSWQWCHFLFKSTFKDCEATKTICFIICCTEQAAELSTLWTVMRSLTAGDAATRTNDAVCLQVSELNWATDWRRCRLGSLAPSDQVGVLFFQLRLWEISCHVSSTPSLRTPPEQPPSPSESPLSTGRSVSYTASSERGWPALSPRESLPLQAWRGRCRPTGGRWPALTEASDGAGGGVRGEETGRGGSRECWVTTINIWSIYSAVHVVCF